MKTYLLQELLLPPFPHSLFALVFADPNTLDEKQTTVTDLPPVCLEQVSTRGR